MDTSTTLEEQIQALMDSLADTALSAAESRHVQRDSHVELLLRAHGIELPEHQPTREQVEAASRTGVNLAQTVSPNRGRQVGVDYLSYTRLMLEAALN